MKCAADASKRILFTTPQWRAPGCTAVCGHCVIQFIPLSWLFLNFENLMIWHSSSIFRLFSFFLLYFVFKYYWRLKCHSQGMQWKYASNPMKNINLAIFPWSACLFQNVCILFSSQSAGRMKVMQLKSYECIKSKKNCVFPSYLAKAFKIKLKRVSFVSMQEFKSGLLESSACSFAFWWSEWITR